MAVTAAAAVAMAVTAAAVAVAVTAAAVAAAAAVAGAVAGAGAGAGIGVRVAEQDLVQVAQLAVAVVAGLDAGIEPGTPVVPRSRDRRSHPAGQFRGELFLQRRDKIFLGTEVLVEEPFGHA